MAEIGMRRIMHALIDQRTRTVTRSEMPRDDSGRGRVWMSTEGERVPCITWRPGQMTTLSAGPALLGGGAGHRLRRAGHAR